MKTLTIVIEHRDVKTLREALNKLCDDFDRDGIYPGCIGMVPTSTGNVDYDYQVTDLPKASIEAMLGMYNS